MDSNHKTANSPAPITTELRLGNYAPFFSGGSYISTNGE